MKPKFSTLRRSDGRIEISCEHGVGHPSFLLTPARHFHGVHGCDGCCGTPEWAEYEAQVLRARHDRVRTQSKVPSA